ncbi:hypothetical protein D3C72_2352890 [compost metagenome]
MIGAASGRVIIRRIWSRRAPSIIAAFSISRGMESKPDFSSQVVNGARIVR